VPHLILTLMRRSAALYAVSTWGGSSSQPRSSMILVSALCLVFGCVRFKRRAVTVEKLANEDADTEEEAEDELKASRE
jgi:hypothetical protein